MANSFFSKSNRQKALKGLKEMTTTMNSQFYWFRIVDMAMAKGPCHIQRPLLPMVLALQHQTIADCSYQLYISIEWTSNIEQIFC